MISADQSSGQKPLSELASVVRPVRGIAPAYDPPNRTGRMCPGKQASVMLVVYIVCPHCLASGKAAAVPACLPTLCEPTPNTGDEGAPKPQAMCELPTYLLLCKGVAS